jgi:electron transport complex protein RnfC
MKLNPALLGRLIENEKFDLALQNNIMDCIECGSCAFICPAHRPLVQHMRRAKAEIRNMKK